MDTRNRIETSLPLSINELYSVPATTRRCPHVSDGDLIRQITVRDTDVSLRLLRGDCDYKRHYLAAKISLVDVTNDKRERPDTSFKICDEKLNGKADDQMHAYPRYLLARLSCDLDD